MQLPPSYSDTPALHWPHRLYRGEWYDGHMHGCGVLIWMDEHGDIQAQVGAKARKKSVQVQGSFLSSAAAGCLYGGTSMGTYRRRWGLGHGSFCRRRWGLGHERLAGGGGGTRKREDTVESVRGSRRRRWGTRKAQMGVGARRTRCACAGLPLTLVSRRVLTWMGEQGCSEAQNVRRTMVVKL